MGIEALVELIFLVKYRVFVVNIIENDTEYDRTKWCSDRRDDVLLNQKEMLSQPNM